MRDDDTPIRSTEFRALLLRTPPQAPSYRAITEIDLRRMRMLMEWESIEALKMVKQAGLEAPCH